jgi:hypothetical protein
MSKDVAIQGVIAILEPKLDDEDFRDELQELLWDDKSILSITYDGGLVYTRKDAEIYELVIGDKETPLSEVTDLIEAIAEHNKRHPDYTLKIEQGTIRPYHLVYWNGGDNPLDTMKAEKYHRKLGRVEVNSSE